MQLKILLLLLFLTYFSTSEVQSLAPEMIQVDGGSFTMGESANLTKENPLHTVNLSTFYLARTETTVAQWKLYCIETGQKLPPTPAWNWQDNDPIVNVSLNDVSKYILWLNKKTGITYRLPTEAEWEYAAKGGIKITEGEFSGGSNLNEVAWYAFNSKNRTHQVATKRSNALGIFDMTGNAAEWCQDRYESYPKGRIINPTGGDKSFFRIVRGGSWYNLKGFCENTHREKYVAGARFDYVGFRLAATVSTHQ